MLTDDYRYTLQGPVPKEWNTTPLESLIETRNGLWKGKKAPFRSARVIRNTNFNNDGTLDLSNVAELDVQINQFESRQLLKGDVIIERSGGGPSQPVGRVVFFDLDESDFSFSNFTTRLRVIRKSDVESKYLLIYLLHFYREGNTNALQSRTTGIRNLNFTDYKQIQIPFPLLPEQRAITHVLSTVRQSIEATEQVIAVSRELKRSMMKHLFAYGPVPIDQADQVPLNETEIGEVPEGWKVVEVGELGEIVTGTTPRTSNREYYDGQYMFISPGDISEEVYVTKTNKFLSGKGMEVSRVLPRETVLVVCIGATIGKTALTSADQSATNQQINAIITHDGVLPHYLYYALTYRAHYLPNLAGRAAIPIVNKSNFAKFPVYLPTHSEQEIISNILSSVDIKIVVEKQRKIALEALFCSLLHHLMTGKFRVGELADAVDN